jgi:hypothetical protein
MLEPPTVAIIVKRMVGVLLLPLAPQVDYGGGGFAG